MIVFGNDPSVIALFPDSTGIDTFIIIRIDGSSRVARNEQRCCVGTTTGIGACRGTEEWRRT
jgi:hypothetical protein